MSEKEASHFHKQAADLFIRNSKLMHENMALKQWALRAKESFELIAESEDGELSACTELARLRLAEIKRILKDS